MKEYIISKRFIAEVKSIIKNLATELKKDFGSGFSVRQLEICRQFYFVFPIANALRSQLNWTQYKLLIRIDNKDKRIYYIEESCKNNWSARQLERQINSQLYERLLISINKEKVLAVAKSEATPLNPQEIIKEQILNQLYIDDKTKQKVDNR